MKRIVLVHAISECGLSIKNMIRYIKWMKLLGFKFVSLDQMIANNIKGRYISLVVDDSYRCVRINLMPILQRYSIPCTLFVPPGLLGLKANDPQLLQHACYKNEDMMTVADLKKKKKNGFEVGFHTNMHIDLSVTDPISQTDDFITGITTLNALGYKPNKFAYPFGRLPKNYISYRNLLLNNGIKYAYTLWPGNADNTEPFLINRICLGDHSPLWWNILKTIGMVDKRLQNQCEIAQRPHKNIIRNSHSESVCKNT